MNHRDESQQQDKSGRAGFDSDATRRGFLKVAVGILAAVNGLLLGVPFLKTLLTPPKTRKSTFAKVGDVSGMPVGEPVKVRFHVQVQDAFYRNENLHMVWVIRHSDGSVTVFSPICPHLGCYYNWDAKTGDFECPCHGSVFAKDGKVLGGPAPRPLDILPHKTQNNILYVQWVTYKPGVPQKVVV